MIFNKKPKYIQVVKENCENQLNSDILSKTIILVPVGSNIEPACDESLRKLEKDGVRVYRKYGFSAIDQGRCVMAQQAIDENYEHIFWIDSDIAFYHGDVYKIINRSLKYNQPFITGAYSVKGWPVLTTKFSSGFDKIIFGKEGGLYEVDHSATGFMYTHLSVYENIKLQYNMKPVKIWGGQYKVHPWFFPMILDDSYIGEDFSFCERAKKSGITLYCDTTVRLAHIGRYSYSFDFLTWRDPLKEPESIIFYNQEGKPADIY